MGFRRIIPASRTGRVTVAAAVASSVAAAFAIVAIAGVQPSSDEADAAVAVAVTPQAPLVPVTEADGAAPGGSPRGVSAREVRLAEYTPAAGRAVLVPKRRGTDKGEVKPGDVIASRPTSKAPHGALFKVGTVTPSAKGLEVTTEPATLRDALGSTEVRRTIEAPAVDVTVKPLVEGVRAAQSAAEVTAPSPAVEAETTPTAGPRPSKPVPATPTPGPAKDAVTASPSARAAALPDVGEIVKPARTPDGGFLLAVDVPLRDVPGISGTGSAPPKLAGWVAFTPKLLFSFGHKKVDGANPFQAQIGVGGKYQYGWQVHAKLDGIADTGEKQLRLPFAEVNLQNTFWVGPVPIVVSVKLTYFYRLTSDGNLTIDTEQSTTGEFALGAQFDSRTGWAPLNRNDATTTKSPTEVITGRGDFRATIGADLAVMLYDAVGVTGRLAPYVQATVDATTPPKVLWGIYVGFDLTGSLNIHLKIFGFTIFKVDIPFPPIHAQWAVATSTPPPPPRPAPGSGTVPTPLPSRL